MSEGGEIIGVITRGSLIEGVEMKLDPEESPEDIKAGKFVVIDGQKNRFFSMITDIRLDATNPDILINPPGRDDELMRKVLSGTSTYVTVSLRPMLTLGKDEGQNGEDEIRPVKTIPSHFSLVREAEEGDVARIFGSEEKGERFFNIGKPLDMETYVCMNLDRFVERSNGIFGKTGTGKTFLTRLVLSGLIKNRRAVNVVFDMHSEYGWGGHKEGGTFVPGLRNLFGGQVAVFSLDPESTRRRGVSPDVEVMISYDDISVEDIAPLQDELRLNPTAVEAAFLVAARYGEGWLRELLSQEGEAIKDFAADVGAHPESFSALHRKLKRIKRFPFLTESPAGDFIQRIMEYIDRGIHVVLEFGQQSSMLCYLLVANIIVRRIHELYVRRTERYLATRDPKDEPKQLVITLEEAHKFLNPIAAKQAVFGAIAREMRKYYVSLLIVDQRPSGIDEEVLSQIGTKIIALLDDEKDIQAVLTGVSNPSSLRGVLASLDSKQQALIIGHAVPMPVVVRTRDYDGKFFTEMGPPEKGDEKLRRETAALYGS